MKKKSAVEVGLDEAFRFGSGVYTPLSNRCSNLRQFFTAVPVVPAGDNKFVLDKNAKKEDDIRVSYGSVVEIVGMVTI